MYPATTRPTPAALHLLCRMRSEQGLGADLECWPVSPPGGLLSPALSAAVAPWCTSLITGKDAVSRLSIGTARLLMDHCVYALAMCRMPKMQCAPACADEPAVMHAMAGLQSAAGRMLARLHTAHAMLVPCVLASLLEMGQQELVNESCTLLTALMLAVQHHVGCAAEAAQEVACGQLLFWAP